mmetsp:Transcript_6187/g.12520  ORF Transcript_6187/g.12520 Transcript_6187/m.12520 type:complete len:89 (-) Transcript_6187:65-331(-)
MLEAQDTMVTVTANFTSVRKKTKPLESNSTRNRPKHHDRKCLQAFDNDDIVRPWSIHDKSRGASTQVQTRNQLQTTSPSKKVTIEQKL